MSVSIKATHQDKRIYLHLSKLGLYTNVGLLVDDAVKLAKTILASAQVDYATTNLYFEDGGMGIGKWGEEIKAD